MSPKRLRLIASIIRQGVPKSLSTSALAQELDQHAAELETLGWSVEEPKEIRIREPYNTVFNEISERFPDAQIGRR